jgi:iron complex outermembrane receptor protein
MLAMLAGLGLAAGPARAATDLAELSLDALLEVPIVGASKYEQRQNAVAAAASVITRKEIKTFGWRTLAEALNSLPGVHITYDRQYTYIGNRGFGLPGDYNTRLLVLINGNRLNDATYDSALLGREFPLDIDLIERIEFIPGPGGAVYGRNAIFGVVNVITRAGIDVDGAELAAAYQSPQSLWHGRATWGKVLDNGADVLLSVSGLDAQGEDRFYVFPGAGPDGADLASVASGLDGERDQEAYARIARGPWSFGLFYGNRRKDDPTAGYFSDPLAPGQYQRDRYVLAQLQYQDSFAGDTLQVLGRLFLNQERYTGIFNYGTQYRSTGSSDWRGGELRLLSTALADHKLMVGVEYQDNARADQTYEDLANPDNNRIDIPTSGYDLGVYAQDEWSLTDNLTATLGLRVDFTDVIDTQWSPRLGLIWQATPATTLKALYGRAHRAPNAYERDYDDGEFQLANPALGGETINTLELVVDHRVAPDLSLRGSVYQWTMLDFITFDSERLQFQSGDTVKARGLELSVDKTWDWGGRLRGSVSYQDVAFANGGGLNNSPMFLGKLNFSSPLPFAGLRLGYELQYDSERQAVDGTDLDSYWLSNLNLMAEGWAKGLEVSLGIYNLFDERYQHPLPEGNWTNALEQDGRSVRLKLDYRF